MKHQLISSQKIDKKLIDQKQGKTETETQEIISNELHLLCQRHHAIALNIDSETLTIVIAENLSHPSEELLMNLRFCCGRKINVKQWPKAKIEKILHQFSSEDISSRENLSNTFNNDITLRPAANSTSLERITSVDHLEIQTSNFNEKNDAPVIQFIHQTLSAAIEKRASDIHFEPYQHCYRIRIRVDGVLQEISSPEFELTPRINGCLKVMAQLNIAEKRLPQDGKFTLRLNNICYSMRIATLPTQYGEKIVLRILHAEQKATLDELGLAQQALAQFIKTLSLPEGLILVTGPTGSGKTMTLYSSLLHLNQHQKNICSIEDPVEIPIKGINQTQINHKIGLDFSSVLRTLLRQDPDIIMVGEIRDNETAEISLKAAHTGHLVLSTLHTNSTTETLARLTQMNIPSYLLASCLKLIIAQRLMRRLCLHCKKPALAAINYPEDIWPKPLHHWISEGCEQCCDGYYGRIGIYEMLVINTEIKQALIDNADTLKLEQILKKQGNITLLKAGLSLVEQGISSVDEIYRVFGCVN